MGKSNKIIRRIAFALAGALVLGGVAGCGMSEKFDWSEANRINTVYAYKDFIRSHPNSRLAEVAKSRISRADAHAFQTAEQRNTVPDYERYIKGWPNGKFRDIAQARLLEIKKIAGVVETTPEEYIANHPELKDQIKRAILNRDIVYGMGPRDVLAAWGTPARQIVTPAVRKAWDNYIERREIQTAKSSSPRFETTRHYSFWGDPDDEDAEGGVIPVEKYEKVQWIYGSPYIMVGNTVTTPKKTVTFKNGQVTRWRVYE